MSTPLSSSRFLGRVLRDRGREQNQELKERVLHGNFEELCGTV